MSAVEASPTANAVIHVKVVDELVEVWRPVGAVSLGDALYRILAEGFEPDVETWEFQPGETVRVATRNDEQGSYLVAVARAAA